MEVEHVQRHLFELFQRHFVMLRVEASKVGAETMTESYSCFIMSVGDEWLLVTAGHCIEEVQNALKQGYSLSSQLFDGLSANAPYKHSIPFVFEDAGPLSLDQFGSDLGILWLRPIYRRMLQANGMLPLAEKGWRDLPREIKPVKFLLLGVPGASTKRFGDTMIYTPNIYPVDELPERPAYIIDPPSGPTFYGQISLTPDAESLKGTSGGPLFLLQVVDGNFKYWLYALQSASYQSERVIIAPLVYPLGRIIEEVIEELNGSQDRGV